MINQNRFSKYLIYAIGEIVLVVIGILIALQVNNWNENRKDSIREQNYLDSLKEDMRNNSQEIQEDIDGNIDVIKSCDSLLLANKKGYQEIDDEKLRSLIYSLGNYSLIQLEQGTIQEIIASGSLQTIRNKDIREFLADWDRNLFGIKELENFSRLGQETYLRMCRSFIPLYKFGYEDTIFT